MLSLQEFYPKHWSNCCARRDAVLIFYQFSNSNTNQFHSRPPDEAIVTAMKKKLGATTFSTTTTAASVEQHLNF